MKTGHRTVWRTAALLMAAWTAAGCGGPSAYHGVFQGPRPENARMFSIDQATCWAAVNRTVLALNFTPEQQDEVKRLLQATRYFGKSRRTRAVRLTISLQPSREGGTMVYANATEVAERVFTRSHRRFFLWVIPLPGGGGVEASRVKEGEWTVSDPVFYAQFFEALGRELKTTTASADRKPE